MNALGSRLTWRTRLVDSEGEIGALYMSTECGLEQTYFVCLSSLQRTVFASLEFSVMCDSDGTMYPSPCGLEDDVLDELLNHSRLRGLPVDLLVEQSFGLRMNEEPAVANVQLREMRQRLMRALVAVEAEIASIEKSDTASPDGRKH